MADNGKGLLLFVGSIIGAVLMVVGLAYQMVYAPLNSAVAAEAYARCQGDEAACEKINTKLDKILNNQEELKVAFATTAVQVAINTKRLDKLECK